MDQAGRHVVVPVIRLSLLASWRWVAAAIRLLFGRSPNGTQLERGPQAQANQGSSSLDVAPGLKPDPADVSPLEANGGVSRLESVPPDVQPELGEAVSAAPEPGLPVSEPKECPTTIELTIEAPATEDDELSPQPLPPATARGDNAALADTAGRETESEEGGVGKDPNEQFLCGAEADGSELPAWEAIPSQAEEPISSANDDHPSRPDEDPARASANDDGVSADANVESSEDPATEPRQPSLNAYKDPAQASAGGNGENVGTPSETPARTALEPRQYRPPSRTRTAPRASRTANGSNTTTSEEANRTLPIGVRLVFERGGFCRISVLPRRVEGLPNEIGLSGKGAPEVLQALQENWYEDVFPPEIGRQLREGIAWEERDVGNRRPTRWSLGGREIYVLASHDELSGYVNVPRLVIGEQHIVVCATEKQAEVQEAIEAAGSTNFALVGEDTGLPSTWVAFRGVVPRQPVDHRGDGDIFDVLRPLAEAEISLAGGIRIGRQKWLSEFPPQICIRGDASQVGAVSIDGLTATVDEGGRYTAPDWSADGDHRVTCSVGTRTYSICKGAEDWEQWDAYRWSLGETGEDGVAGHPAICGAIVRRPLSIATHRQGILVPETNPILIGALPGQIEYCAPREDARVGFVLGFTDFAPVWALPLDPRRMNREMVKILLVSDARRGSLVDLMPSAASTASKNKPFDPKVLAWSMAIRASGAKRLQLEPEQEEISAIWRAYKQRARELRRRW